MLIILLPKLIFAQQNRPLVFRNVTLIDMRSEQPKANMTVVVEGNRISKIGKSLKISKDAEVVDASGKYLIPGLWDMHVHIFNNVSAPGTNNKDNYFPLFIANGVTGVRDMFTDPDDIKLVREWQSEADAGKLLAPRIAPGSSIVDGVPVIQKNSLGVSTPDEARRAVRMLKDSGAGFIKVYGNLSRECYYAIADEAKRQKIPFAGHVPNSITPVEASNAGQKSIEHLWRMLIACSSKEDKFKNFKRENWTPELQTELRESFSEKKCREVSAVFVKNNTWHVPTFPVLRAKDDIGFAKDERLRYVPQDEAQDWIKSIDKYNPADRETRAARFQIDLDILKIMHRAGVPILAGTDVGNEFVYAGFSLHDELYWMTQARLTPYEALQTATINPAKYLEMKKSLGTIERGKLADLVLLDANPLADISNTRKINSVVANGKLLDRNTLDKMLADVEAAAKKK